MESRRNVKRVEYFLAKLPDPVRPGRFFRTRHLMLREDIERGGGMVREHTKVTRDIPETPEEHLDALYRAAGTPLPHRKT